LIETRSPARPVTPAAPARGSLLGVSIDAATASVADGAEIGTATQAPSRAAATSRESSDSVSPRRAVGAATLQSRRAAALANPVGPDSFA
jgi:hypothetical protein